jgi:hypothetical protein
MEDLVFQSFVMLLILNCMFQWCCFAYLVIGYLFNCYTLHVLVIGYLFNCYTLHVLVIRETIR